MPVNMMPNLSGSFPIFQERPLQLAGHKRLQQMLHLPMKGSGTVSIGLEPAAKGEPVFWLIFP